MPETAPDAPGMAEVRVYSPELPIHSAIGPPQPNSATGTHLEPSKASPAR